MDGNQDQLEQCFNLKAKQKQEANAMHSSLVSYCNSILFCFFFGVYSCADVVPKSNAFQSVGDYNSDSLETGLWEIRNENGITVEKGEMSNGVRTGPWIYSLTGDTIIWNETNIEKIAIRTNLPSLLNLVDVDSQTAIFKSADSAAEYSIMFGTFELLDSIGFEEIESELQSTFSSKKISITDSTRSIISTSNGQRFMYKQLKGKYTETRKEFGMFGFFGRSGNRKFVEVVVKFDWRLIDKSKLIFFSIIQNLYLDGKRFLPLKDKISTDLN